LSILFTGKYSQLCFTKEIEMKAIRYSSTMCHRLNASLPIKEMIKQSFSANNILKPTISTIDKSIRALNERFLRRMEKQTSLRIQAGSIFKDKAFFRIYITIKDNAQC